MPDIDYYSQENMKNARVSEWYDRVVSDLDKCPFCDLKDKYIIVEKDGMVLTVNLFAYIDGHMLIVPLRHIENFDDISKKEWAGMQYLAGVGIKLVKEELGIDNTNVLYREGGKSGTSLKHLHWHILPITPEFMQYHKTHFTWEYQKLNFSPLEMAERLRNAFKKLSKSK